MASHDHFPRLLDTRTCELAQDRLEWTTLLQAAKTSQTELQPPHPYLAVYSRTTTPAAFTYRLLEPLPLVIAAAALALVALLHLAYQDRLACCLLGVMLVVLTEDHLAGLPIALLLVCRNMGLGILTGCGVMAARLLDYRDLNLQIAGASVLAAAVGGQIWTSEVTTQSA
jgi:hypothetical protein